MNLKHLSIGILLIIIGIAILSPLDDLLILIPLSIVIGPEIFPVVMAIGAICTIIGIFLVGKTTLKHLGMIGRIVASHPVIVLGGIIIICILVYYILTGEINI